MASTSPSASVSSITPASAASPAHHISTTTTSALKSTTATSTHATAHNDCSLRYTSTRPSLCANLWHWHHAIHAVQACAPLHQRRQPANRRLPGGVRRVSRQVRPHQPTEGGDSNSVCRPLPVSCLAKPARLHHTRLA